MRPISTDNLNRFRPPRAPEEVKRDVAALTAEIVEMLEGLTTTEGMS